MDPLVALAGCDSDNVLIGGGTETERVEGRERVRGERKGERERARASELVVAEQREGELVGFF